MSSPARPPSAVWRGLMLGLAALFFFLATLGLFLPVLPTTPFLLLTSILLVRTSPRLHQKLLQSRVFGGFLRDWDEHRGIRPHIRWTALSVMAAVAVGSFWLADLGPWLKAVLLGLVLLGSVVVLRLPVIR